MFKMFFGLISRSTQLIPQESRLLTDPAFYDLVDGDVVPLKEGFIKT